MSCTDYTASDGITITSCNLALAPIPSKTVLGNPAFSATAPSPTTIAAVLGYSPANQAGDVFSGAVIVAPATLATVSPLGNDGFSTKSAVASVVKRGSGMGRVFTAQFGAYTADAGATGQDDTVGLYAAARAFRRDSSADDTGVNKADIWAANFLLRTDDKSGIYNARCLEIDIDHFRDNSAETKATLLAGNLVVGLQMLGSPYSLTATAGYVIDNVPEGSGRDLVRSGYVVGPHDPCAQSSFADFGNASISYEDTGNHDWGIKQTGAVGQNRFAGNTIFKPNVSNSRLVVQGPVAFSSGAAIVSTSEMSGSYMPLELYATDFLFRGGALDIQDGINIQAGSLFGVNLDNTSLRNVSYGAADSGGSGFRCLRVPN